MPAPLDFDGRWVGPRNVGTKTLGTAWADIGSALRVGGARWVRAFFSLQIHNGTSPQFRMLGQYSASGSAFGLVAQQSGTGTVTVAAQVYQLADADQFTSLPWELSGGVPFIKLQGRVAAGTAAYVSDARLTTSI